MFGLLEVNKNVKTINNQQSTKKICLACLKLTKMWKQLTTNNQPKIYGWLSWSKQNMRTINNQPKKYVRLSWNKPKMWKQLTINNQPKKICLAFLK